MGDAYGRVYAEINLNHLRRNLRAIRASLRDGQKLCCIVKADAYGHGAVKIARTAEDEADFFAVASAEEGVELREAGISRPILVLGSVSPCAYEAVLLHDLSIALFQEERAALLAAEAARLSRRAKIHIAVDTGMGRIGVTPDARGLELVRRIAAHPEIEIEGCFTHYARADEDAPEKTAAQAEAFRQFLVRAEAEHIDLGVTHALNSAGIAKGLLPALDMVRAGIILYGLTPSEETDCTALSLKPLMSLRTYLSYLKEVEAGTEIGYGSTFTAPRRMRIGTLSAGYADGYPRMLNGKGSSVLLGGVRCPIVGRICMDQIMIDVSGVPEAKEGDEATLFGADAEGRGYIGAEELAALYGGSHYEILCDVSKRVPRVYLG